MSLSARILKCLDGIYGPELAAQVGPRLGEIVSRHAHLRSRQNPRALSERDVFLIAYPDQIQEPNKAPLVSLADFSAEYLQGIIGGMHLLPFYPSSSDDGFAVIDYRSVPSEYGSWDDVRRLAQRFRLMFDAVINHSSAKSEWFQAFLRGDPAYRDYFIKIEGQPDLSQVVRPRSQPLLTMFRGPAGNEVVWTTFGADQVDLNYHEPKVLLEAIEILMFYAEQGALFIRLDAVPYLWKEIGSSCINLPQTHAIVQLVRAIFDEVAPAVQLVAEANVPPEENVRYFGDGFNEAHLVYNFALAPLVLHAFHSAQPGTLARWAAQLNPPSPNCTFFNILASHDGIGLNPVRGILTEPEIASLISRVEAAGGLVSRRSDANGLDIPYEINANYFDALGGPEEELPLTLKIDRFLTAHAIMLSLKGLPGIYFHSLVGSRGWPAGVVKTGRARSINREKLRRGSLEAQLRDEGSMRARIFAGLRRLLAVRSQYPAFSPQADQQVYESQGSVLALSRHDPSTGGRVLCVYNVSAKNHDFRPESAGGQDSMPAMPLYDLLAGRMVDTGKSGTVTLAPYESMWLMPMSEEKPP